MFSVPKRAQHTQEAECPCDVCLAWSLAPEQDEALFAAVSGVASSLEVWFPLSDQEQAEARLLTSLGLLFPTAGNDGSYQLTALGLRVAVARLLIAEALLLAASASAAHLAHGAEPGQIGMAEPYVH